MFFLIYPRRFESTLNELISPMTRTGDKYNKQVNKTITKQKNSNRNERNKPATCVQVIGSRNAKRFELSESYNKYVFAPFFCVHALNVLLLRSTTFETHHTQNAHGHNTELQNSRPPGVIKTHFDWFRFIKFKIKI